MTLQGILTAIGNLSINDRLVGLAAAGNSIYEVNDLTVCNYPLLFISPTGTHRISDNYTSYALTLFYIDRLAEDNSNSVAIHSTAIEVLKNLIRKIRGLEGVVDISDEYAINLFTEQEKFKDRCNGAYATLEVTLVNDTVCAIYTNETPEEGYYFYFKNKQGESLPYTIKWNTVAWETDCPEIRYEFFKSGEFIGGGITSGGTATIFFGENTEEYPIGFEMNAYDNETGDKLGRLFWSQQAAPEEYFNFFNQDWEALESGTTAYTLTWETNITDGVDYVVVDGNGNEVASGHTTDNSLTIYFPENTGSTDETYTIYVTDRDRNVVGELNWTVEGEHEEPHTNGNVFLGTHEGGCLTEGGIQEEEDLNTGDRWEENTYVLYGCGMLLSYDFSNYVHVNETIKSALCAKPCEAEISGTSITIDQSADPLFFRAVKLENGGIYLDALMYRSGDSTEVSMDRNAQTGDLVFFNQIHADRYQRIRFSLTNGIITGYGEQNGDLYTNEYGLNALLKLYRVTNIYDFWGHWPPPVSE